MAGAKQKSPSAVAVHERLSETVNKGVQEAKKATANEAKESGKTFLRQLLGMEVGGGDKGKSNHAEAAKPEKNLTTTGVEIIDIFVSGQMTTEKKKSSEKAPRIEAAMNYSGEIARSGERATKAEMSEMSQNIQEIKAELNQLLASSKVLQMEFAEVAMEQTPVDAGKYHVNFFDWMLIVLRQARQKVEDSGAWLSAVKGKGKGKAKTDYSIANGKMHQSGERTTVQNAVG
jgi:hypothetical protein